MPRVHSLQVPELCHNLEGEERRLGRWLCACVRGVSQKVKLRCNAVGGRSDESQGDGVGDSGQGDGLFRWVLLDCSDGRKKRVLVPWCSGALAVDAYSQQV
jgi:hypothetical protein